MRVTAQGTDDEVSLSLNEPPHKLNFAHITDSLNLHLEMSYKI